MKVGCLFGTFDPPHCGHLQVAEWMRDHMGLEEVWFIITPQNPFKSGAVLSPEGDRLQMVKLAVSGHKGLKAMDLEFGLPKPSYTVHTLEHLRSAYPEVGFALLMGSDNLLGFDRWKDPEGILAHHRVLVYPRPGGADLSNVPAFIARHPNLTYTEAPLMDVSATDIRRRFAAGRGAKGLVAPGVASYILRKGLYTG